MTAQVPTRWTSLVLGTAAWALALLCFGISQVERLTVDRPLASTSVYAYIVITFAIGAIIGVGVLRTSRVGLLVFAGAQAFWFAWPAVKRLMTGQWIAEGIGYHYLTDRDVVMTSLSLMLFATACYATYALVSLHLPRLQMPHEAPIRPITDRQLVWIALLLIGLGILPFLIYGESLQAVVSGILGSRSGSADRAWAQTAFESRPIYVIGRASLVAAGALSLHRFLSAWNHPRAPLWLAGFTFAFLVTYFDSGTRSWTASILVPGAIDRIRASLAGRGMARVWLIMAPVVLIATLWLAQLQLAFRSTGVTTDVLAEGGTLEVHDNDFFSETAVAVSLVPRHMEYVRESSLVLFVANPIPRSLWPNKPYPRVIESYGIGRLGTNEYRETGVSRMPSIVGQYHMSGGAAGVISIGMVIGGVLAFLDAVARSPKATTTAHIWVAITSVWLFMSHRGLFPGFHYPVLIVGAIVLFERVRSLPPHSAGIVRQPVNPSR